MEKSTGKTKQKIAAVEKKKKKKRNTTKNTLANPFSLDWPSINYKYYVAIMDLLRSSLTLIGEDFIKYKEEGRKRRMAFRAVRKISRAKVNGSLEENQCSPESDNTVSLEKDPLAEEKTSSKELNGIAIGNKNLVFGYNAVIRGLAKGTVVSVLVNVKVKPEFIIKTFIPLCTLKSIPIIPLDKLQECVKESGLGIKSCIALGLRREVIQEDSIFHNLYLKTCEALSFSPAQEVEPPAQVVSTPSLVIVDKSRSKFRKKLSVHEPSAEIVNKSQSKNQSVQKVDGYGNKESSGKVFESSDLPSVAVASVGSSAASGYLSLDTTHCVTWNETLRPEVNSDDSHLNFMLSLEGQQLSREGEVILESRPFLATSQKKQKLQFKYVETRVKRIKTNPDKKANKK